jgi:diaminopimelate decarboxylase
MNLPEHLSPDALENLAAQHGDAFYVFDLDRFRCNLDRFRGAFREYYPDTDLAYSYKTNYTPRLASIVDSWGGWAEVVSELELDLALRLGVDAGRIIYNGPAKTSASLRSALSGGSIVNVDSPAQLTEVIELANHIERAPIGIGVRLAFAIDDVAPTRFGLDASDEEGLRRAFAEIRANAGVTLRGVHAHVSSGSRHPRVYRDLASELLRVVDRFDLDIEFVDIGGGYFSSLPPELEEQFGFRSPTPEDYAEAVGPVMVGRFGTTGGPRLVIEPGVGVVGDAGHFVCRIHELRTIHGRSIIQTAGSIHNIKPTLNRFDMPLAMVGTSRSVAEQTESADLVGYTCMEHDVLSHAYGGPVPLGGFAVFGNVGAYTNVLAPSFIRGRPAIVGWSGAGSFEVLKYAELLPDVLASYVL